MISFLLIHIYKLPYTNSLMRLRGVKSGTDCMRSKTKKKYRREETPAKKAQDEDESNY
jgi:hypothetical protein